MRAAWILLLLVVVGALPAPAAAEGAPHVGPWAQVRVVPGPAPGDRLFDLTGSIPANGAANRLENPGFENGISGWGLVSTRGDVRLDFDPDGTEGNQSLRLHVPPGEAGSVDVLQTVDLAGGSYEARVDVREDGGAQNVSLRLAQGANASLLLPARGPYWQPLWTPFRAEGATQFVLRVDVAAGRGATVWFDNARLRAGLTYDWRLDGEPFATPAPLFATRFQAPGHHVLKVYAAQDGTANETTTEFNVTQEELASPAPRLEILGPQVVPAGEASAWNAGGSRDLTGNLLVNANFARGMQGWVPELDNAPRFLELKAEEGAARLAYGQSAELRSVTIYQVVPVRMGTVYDVTAAFRGSASVRGFAFLLREVGFPEGRYVARTFRDTAWEEPATSAWTTTRQTWSPTYPETTHVLVMLRALVRGNEGVVEFRNASIEPAPALSWRLDENPIALPDPALPEGPHTLSVLGPNGTRVDRSVVAFDPSRAASFRAMSDGSVAASGELPGALAGGLVNVTWNGSQEGREQAAILSDGSWTCHACPRWTLGKLTVRASLAATPEVPLGERAFTGGVDDLLAIEIGSPPTRLRTSEIRVRLDDPTVRAGRLVLERQGLPSIEVALRPGEGGLVGNLTPGFLTRPGAYAASLVLETPSGESSHRLAEPLTVRLADASPSAAPWTTVLFAGAAAAGASHLVATRRRRP